MPEFPSEEWLAEYVERINDSPSYKEAAATWEGDVAYVIEAEPDRGLEEDVWAWLDLWHGECRGGKVRHDRGGQGHHPEAHEGRAEGEGSVEAPRRREPSQPTALG
jgi:hypothetical protein